MRASQQIRTPLDVSGAIFEAVQGWVSHQALRKVQEQRQLLLAPLKAPCSQSFTSSYGLPCSHTLKKLEDAKQCLLLEHFHPHWNLRRGVDRPRPILEPRRVPKQGIQTISQPATSTRRQPSGFEIVQSVKKASRTCSRCQEVGHIRSSRACPLRFQELLTQTAPASKSVPQPDATPVAVPAPTDSAENVSVAEGTWLAEDIQDCHGEAIRDSPAAAHFPFVQPSPILQESLAAPHSPVATMQSPAGGESPVHEPPHVRDPPLQSPRYDSPQAIYGRYVATRSAWYAAQPTGSIKTNQQYRKAVGLPQRYDKQSYEWCLDYKQMSKRCITSTGSREWTKEEMVAYLDWSKAEDKRIEAQVTKEMGDNPLANRRRGVQEVWRSVERDSKEQEALHMTKDSTERCIVVKL